MPLIQISTNKQLPNKDVFIKDLSAFVADMLNKSEKFVMVNAIENTDMLFGGSIAPLAYIELKSIALPVDDTKQLSSAICAFIESNLNIERERIYIEFSDASRSMWGWNGSTFER